MDYKAKLIGEIEAIYRDHHHTHYGKPLSEYPEAALRRHLLSLQAGAEWIKGGKKKKATGGTPALPQNA